MRRSNIKRILIFGVPGSGKSTFAFKLSHRLHIPLFHLDKYFFVKDWQERDYEEFLALEQMLVKQESWIIDGNALRSLEVRFARADIVLYFRFNRLLCLWRIFNRLIYKHPFISDRAEGCSERVGLRLIRYLWGFHRRVKSRVKELQDKYPSVSFYELRSNQELDAWEREHL